MPSALGAAGTLRWRWAGAWAGLPPQGPLGAAAAMGPGFLVGSGGSEKLVLPFSVAKSGLPSTFFKLLMQS